MISDIGVVGGPTPAPESEEPPRRRWTPDLRRKVLLGVVLLWAVAITAAVLLRGGGGDKPTAAVTPAPSPSASDGPLSVAEVYRTLLPSVVRIEAGGEGRTDTETAIGTGVIANADGTILTALHVVDGADSDPGDRRRRHHVGGRPSPAPTRSGTSPRSTPATLPEPCSCRRRSAAGGSRSATPWSRSATRSA